MAVVIDESGYDYGEEREESLKREKRLEVERDALREENARLREALKSIKDGEIYPRQVAIKALSAEAIAKQALAGGGDE